MKTIVVAALLVVIATTLLVAALWGAWSARSARGWLDRLRDRWEYDFRSVLQPPQTISVRKLMARSLAVVVGAREASVTGQLYVAKTVVVGLDERDLRQIDDEYPDGQVGAERDLMTSARARLTSGSERVRFDPAFSVRLHSSPTCLEGRPRRIFLGSSGQEATAPPAPAEAPAPHRPADPVGTLTLVQAPEVDPAETIDEGSARAASPVLDPTRTWASGSARLRPEGVGEEVDLPGDAGRPLLAGRGPKVDIRLSGRVVSNIHANFQREPSGWTVRDERSRNGVYVNGARVSEALLHDGDEVAFAKDGPRFRFFSSAVA